MGVKQEAVRGMAAQGEYGQPWAAVLRSFVPVPGASLWSPLYVPGLDLPFFLLSSSNSLTGLGLGLHPVRGE